MTDTNTARETEREAGDSDGRFPTFWKSILDGHTVYYRVSNPDSAEYVTEGGHRHETTVYDILLGSRVGEFGRVETIEDTPFTADD